MKLIVEDINNIDCGYEINEAKEKQWFLEGIYMQAEVVNNNNRKYPKDILMNEVNRFIDEKIKTNQSAGELNHPKSPNVNPERISHKIINLEEQGNNVYGKSLVTNTPMGNIVKGLLEADLAVAMSSRALGSCTNESGIFVVGKNYNLRTVDIVIDPGAPEAFQNGVLEGVEYIVEDGAIKEVAVEEMEKILSSNPRTVDIYEELKTSFNKLIRQIS